MRSIFIDVQRKKRISLFVLSCIFFLLIVSSTGLFSLHAQSAGTNAALSVEPETGTLSGPVQIIADSNASNGQYIMFTAPPTATPTPTPTQLAISNITVADTANAKNYSLQSNMQQGNTLYGDRTYTIKTLPVSLSGSQWIRTANNSKTWNNGSTLLSFTINKQATVSVAIDKRLKKFAWMDNTWIDSGMKISDSEIITFEVFQKTFPSGTVSLGPNAGPTASDMYIVVAQ